MIDGKKVKQFLRALSKTKYGKMIGKKNLMAAYKYGKWATWGLSAVFAAKEMWDLKKKLMSTDDEKSE